MNNYLFKFLCMQLCEKYRGKTFEDIVEDICVEVSDCTIRLEDCYFRSNVDCTEFRIFSYTIFILCNDSVYFENQYHEDRRIDLTNLVGELDDIV